MALSAQLGYIVPQRYEICHIGPGDKTNASYDQTVKQHNKLSLLLTAIFQVNLGWPVFIEAKDDGGGGDNWTTGAISRAKLQSNHHHKQTNIQIFYRPDALPVAQPTVTHRLKHSLATWLTQPAERRYNEHARNRRS